MAERHRPIRRTINREVLTMPEIDLDSPEVLRAVKSALDEDIGSGDITTKLIVPENSNCRAAIIAKERGVIAGLPIARMVFKELDRRVEFSELKSDGDVVEPDEAVSEVSGPARAVLSGERVALNYVGRLSGIATTTREFVKAVEGLGVKILDTRKTAPCLRVPDKYAVRVGGGTNHRMGLYDCILIKDNHIKTAGNVEHAIALVRERAQGDIKIEIEAAGIDEVKSALAAGADRILLDNMTPSMVREAMGLINGKAEAEVSGGVNLNNVREYAQTGVDYISIGYLTHSSPALDVSLRML